MKKPIVRLLPVILTLTVLQSAKAATIADWTFDTSNPTNLTGPYSPEVGSGAATGSGFTYFNAVGVDGSAHAFGGSRWQVGNYWQFTTSTVGFEDITISYNQIRSSTGPTSFLVEYSTDGNTFSTFATNSVQTTPNLFTEDLSSIGGLENDAIVYFRLVANVAGATMGTSSVDNFTVNGVAPVPEPSTMAMAACGGLAGFFAFGRKR